MSLDAEMPQRMLNAAAAFYIAATRCHGTVRTATTSYATHAPPIVNYAFSIELYLKLLILITTGRMAPPRHKLVNLYDKLSDETRAIVVASWKFPGDPDHLRNLMKDASDDFVRWRYAHEYDLLIASPDELHDIARADRALARRPEDHDRGQGSPRSRPDRRRSRLRKRRSRPPASWSSGPSPRAKNLAAAQRRTRPHQVAPLLGGEVAAVNIGRDDEGEGVGVSVQHPVLNQGHISRQPDRRPSAQPVAPVEELVAIRCLNEDDRLLQAVVLDVLAERRDLVGCHHRKEIGRRMNRQHVAPGLAQRPPRCADAGSRGRVGHAGRSSDRRPSLADGALLGTAVLEPRLNLAKQKTLPPWREADRLWEASGGPHPPERRSRNLKQSGQLGDRQKSVTITKGRWFRVHLAAPRLNLLFGGAS